MSSLSLIRIRISPTDPTVPDSHHCGMRNLRSRVTGRRRSDRSAFAVVVLFFGLAFIDSLDARSWGTAILFASIAILALVSDARRPPRADIADGLR